MRWRAAPPHKQRAPSRVLFERDVEKRPRRVAFTYSPRARLCHTCKPPLCSRADGDARDAVTPGT